MWGCRVVLGSTIPVVIGGDFVPESLQACQPCLLVPQQADQSPWRSAGENGNGESDGVDAGGYFLNGSFDRSDIPIHLTNPDPQPLVDPYFRFLPLPLCRRIPGASQLASLNLSCNAAIGQTVGDSQASRHPAMYCS